MKRPLLTKTGAIAGRQTVWLGIFILALLLPSLARADEKSPTWVVAVDGKLLEVHPAQVLRGGPAFFATFNSQGGPDEVCLTREAPVKSARVLPESSGIQPVVSGNQICFSVPRPACLTIEIDGRIDEALHLFVNPPDSLPPSADDSNVVFFGRGVHEIVTLRPESGKTIYLAEGAVLRAVGGEKSTGVPVIELAGITDVTIRGRGILDLSQLPWHSRKGVWIGNSSNVTIDGITILDAPDWAISMEQSRNVTIRNVKQICFRENSDGIDISNSQDVLVENCFIRNNDDAVCVKTLLPAPAMEAKNILVRGCVIWNERARALGITSETLADISNVMFRDCDVIHDFSEGGECAALAVLVSDSGTISNIQFENIRVGVCRDTAIKCWIGKDAWSRDNERGHIRGITFKNVEILSDREQAPRIKLEGFSDAHLIEDVIFQGVTIQGRKMGGAIEAGLDHARFTRNIVFVP